MAGDVRRMTYQSLARVRMLQTACAFPHLVTRSVNALSAVPSWGMLMNKLCSKMLVAGVAIFFGCSGGSGGYQNPTDPGTGGDTCPAGTVCMRAAAFSPTSLTVSNNTTVTFNNNSTVDHNVVFDTPIPAATSDIGLIAYGSSATRAFGTVGTYNFHCTIHPLMTGRVIVQ